MWRQNGERLTSQAATEGICQISYQLYFFALNNWYFPLESMLYFLSPLQNSTAVQWRCKSSSWPCQDWFVSFFFTVFLNFQICLFSKLKILVLRFWKGKTGHTTIATCNSHTVPLGPLCLWQWFLNLCWYFLYFQSCNLHFWTTSPHPFPSVRKV